MVLFARMCGYNRILALYGLALGGCMGYSSTDTAMQETLRDIINSYVATLDQASASKAEAKSGAAS